MNGNGTFNPQILVDKLAKLNSSQQSIETLSHWCIFHRKKARQVVETWDRQFHHSPREQRISFLYLANDILQNSRRKGLEFVAEFWKVLPDALNDVIEKSDDFGRKAALRLVDIWEDRKVFGSRGQVLKDELLGRNPENRHSTGKKSGNEFKHPAGELLEKILSSYDLVYDGMDEDALFGRCRTAISSIEKIEKEIGNDFSIGNISGSGSIEELKGWYNILRECVEQLKIAESSRMGLQSHLREALHEQELKTEQIRDQLQVVLARYEQASNILQRLPTKDPSGPLPDPKPDEPPAPSSDVHPIFPVETHVSPGENKQELTPVRYTQQQPPPPPPTIGSPHTEEHRKNAAAEVAAKLAASTSSAQMLSYVLSSLASEGKIGGQSAKEAYPSDSKKPKVDDSVPPYVPPPPPPFPHPDSVNPPPPPPPPPAMPLMPPLMPAGPQFIPPTGPMMGVPYNYGSSPLQIPSSLTPYPMLGIPHYPLPSNPFHGFQTSESVGSFGQPPPPLPATPPPLSRQ